MLVPRGIGSKQGQDKTARSRTREVAGRQAHASRMSPHATGSEGAEPERPPCLLPKLRQGARTAARHTGGGRARKAAAAPTPWSPRTRPGHEHFSREPRWRRPGTAGWEQTRDEITRKAEPCWRRLADRGTCWRRRITQRKGGGKQGREGDKRPPPADRACQVPGGRFGGQDQKGSLTRRSFLCSDSPSPPVPTRRAPPPCRRPIWWLRRCELLVLRRGL